MTHAYSPNGFDDERKRQAAECESKWETATATATFLAVGAAAIGSPLAAGLLVIASLGAVLKYPFTRIKNDPPRHDYVRPAEIRAQTLDSTVLSVMLRKEDGDLAIALVAMPSAMDRVAANLEALVTAVERAAGAWNDRSLTHCTLRIREAQGCAVSAEASVSAMTSAADEIGSFVPRDLAETARNMDGSLPVGSFFDPLAIDLYQRAHADEAFLHQPLGFVLREPPETELPLREASSATDHFIRQLNEALPTSLADFRRGHAPPGDPAPGEESGGWVPGGAAPAGWVPGGARPAGWTPGGWVPGGWVPGSPVEQSESDDE